jgi:plasmid stabilization system protein ParE
MAFRIEFARSAELDIIELVDYIAGDSPPMAKKWFDELFASLETLRELPLRHALIPEANDLKRELRSIHHYSHRIVYEVQAAENCVYIVRIYHGARRALTAKDIQ